MNPDVIHMAQAIQSISLIEGDGLITLGYVESYCDAIGIDDIDYGERLIYEALELMVDEGVAVEEGGEYYMKEERDDWKAREEEELADAEQAELDARISYGQSIWG